MKHTFKHFGHAVGTSADGAMGPTFAVTGGSSPACPIQYVEHLQPLTENPPVLPGSSRSTSMGWLLDFFKFSLPNRKGEQRISKPKKSQEEERRKRHQDTWFENEVHPRNPYRKHRIRHADKHHMHQEHELLVDQNWKRDLWSSQPRDEGKVQDRRRKQS